MENLLDLMLRFGFDIAVVFVVIYFIYKKYNDNNTFIFTYFTFNILIFFICYLMVNLDLGIGFAFGLFALFSIMRYRTTTIEIKEMTYLFVVVCTAVMNALGGHNGAYVEILFINTAIIVVLWFLEYLLFSDKTAIKMVTYEKVELVNADKQDLLLADIKERTGLEVLHVKVLSINYLNDSAVLEVLHRVK